MASIARTGPSILAKPRRPHQVSRQTRCFSQTTRREEARQPRIDFSKVMPAQRNAQSRMKNLKRNEIPDDIGLLPNTFVRPTYAEGPSLFGSEWRKRLKMDYVYIKQMSRDTITMLWFNMFPGKRNKNAKVPLSKKERLQVARTLHTRLYTAIAKSDAAGIEKVALSGLAQQQLSRLQRRRMAYAPDIEEWSCKYRGMTLAERLYWFLQPFIPFKAVKIVSDRVTDLPFGGLQLRQFIVRIRSEQTRDKRDGSRPITKQVTEYMVVQRVAAEGKAEEWKIWGTTKPSTYQEAVSIDSDNKSENQGGSLTEKFKERVSGMGLNM